MDNSFTSEFNNLYKQRGFISVAEKPLSLPYVCSNQKVCWKDTNSIPEDDPSHTAIYDPWIGPRFGELRLVIVGINLNQDGGRNEMNTLVKIAISEIRNGHKRVSFGNKKKKYGGTLLFHRVGAYAAFYARAAGLLHFDALADGFPDSKFVVAGFDFIAYTNHIKCSPTSKGSKPTLEMWKSCGRHVLRQELELLQPNKILVLGKDNYVHFVENVFDQPVQVFPSGSNIQKMRANLANKLIHVIGVPHPQSRGYHVRNVFADLCKELGTC